jgi:hypothetical protein
MAVGWCHGSDHIVAVSSRVTPGYVRAHLANGSVAPETYVFGNGGLWEESSQEPGLASMSFLDVAHTIARPLADRHYVPGTNPKTTKLLIMVYWGATRPPGEENSESAFNLLDSTRSLISSSATSVIATPNHGDSGIAQTNDAAYTMLLVDRQRRVRDDYKTAQMLGYETWWTENLSGMEGMPWVNARRQIMLDELEAERYFVVLLAYDWQALSQHKQHKLLWETRYSVSARSKDFQSELALMSREASSYFGRDSGGLVHDVPAGHVEVGVPRVVSDTQR